MCSVISRVGFDFLLIATGFFSITEFSSEATVQKFDVPLSEATTSSLEALEAYTLGENARSPPYDGK